MRSIRSRFFAVSIFLMFCFVSCEKELTAEQVVQNSINFHDPSGNWSNFQDTLEIVLSMPGESDRFSEVLIDFPEEHFSLVAIQDSISKTYSLIKKDCILKLNGSNSFSEAEAEAHNLNCNMAKLYKDYYEFLYGLPMKLHDPGTQIEEVEKVTFKNKEYLKVEVTYDEKVGSDIWNFYFDPETFALEVYQFFKSDESGAKIGDSGEYILLDDLKEIDGVRMPKIRTWYYNSDDSLLGQDILQ